jgi:hypothetical protein
MEEHQILETQDLQVLILHLVHSLPSVVVVEALAAQ